MSGIWVEEGFYECGEYLTQKPRKNKKIKSCLEIEKKFCLVEIAKKHEESFPSLLGHVTLCNILSKKFKQNENRHKKPRKNKNTKIILFKRLYFHLKFLNPK